MFFILKLICCVGGTVIFAGVVTAFINWWESRPIVEENESPFYITRTYKEIQDAYEN